MIYFEPDRIFSGDSVTWRRSFSNYRPSDGWVLTYALRGLEDLDVIATAAPDADEFVILITAATSEALSPGEYSFAAVATRDVGEATERVTLTTGHITVKPDPLAPGTGTDALTYNEKTLRALKAAYAGASTKTLASHSINGTAITRLSKTELAREITRFERLVREERRARNARRGGRTSRLIKTRF